MACTMECHDAASGAKRGATHDDDEANGNATVRTESTGRGPESDRTVWFEAPGEITWIRVGGTSAICLGSSRQPHPDTSADVVSMETDSRRMLFDANCGSDIWVYGSTIRIRSY